MSIEKVREHFTALGIADRIMEFEVSSATVELAAVAVGVEGARIAKTLSFLLKEEPILIVILLNFHYCRRWSDKRGCVKFPF